MNWILSPRKSFVAWPCLITICWRKRQQEQPVFRQKSWKWRAPWQQAGQAHFWRTHHDHLANCGDADGLPRPRHQEDCQEEHCYKVGALVSADQTELQVSSLAEMSKKSSQFNFMSTIFQHEPVFYRFALDLQAYSNRRRNHKWIPGDGTDF